MTYTWKVVYVPQVMNGGMRGVAFVEAATKAEASWTFKYFIAFFVEFKIRKDIL